MTRAQVLAADREITLGKAIVLQGDALKLAIPDESVDLIVTSPPYFALRSYQDGGEHYDGQIGSEPTPQDFLEALWAATREMVRVLKPTGSIFVNLGDKYAGSGGHNNSNISRRHTQPLDGGKGCLAKMDANEAKANEWKASRRSAPDRYNQESGAVRAKSLMGLPWRYAIGCIDDLGLILRAEIIWSKPNGLPESVTDRVRRSHEQWFHMVKEGRYFAALDEIREPSSGYHRERVKIPTIPGQRKRAMLHTFNPLGKLPGSVWTVPTEPLKVPEELGDHFAAFPSAWPLKIIQGWSPTGICAKCDEPRRPVVETERVSPPAHGPQSTTGKVHGDGRNDHRATTERFDKAHEITGYACACAEPTADTRPAVVLDPFGGTGTTAMVARALGRIGISVDLSSDYCRLASWRIFDSGHDLKVIARTKGKAVAKGEADRREKADAGFLSLFDEAAS